MWHSLIFQNFWVDTLTNRMTRIFRPQGGTQLYFWYVWHEAPKWGLKNWFFAKVRSEELKFFNILKAYELKFEPNLDCRVETSSNFWQISLVGAKISYFCSKWGSKELNHAATGDLKNSRRGLLEKRVLTIGHTHTTFSDECPSRALDNGEDTE